MPNLKIKTLEEKTGTAGLHMGGGPERRKLQPGEIVFIPDDEQTASGENLLDVLYATGKVELTPEAPNRPLDFANEHEAKLTSPTFKITGQDAANEVAQAKKNVAERMAAINARTAAKRTTRVAESPDTEESTQADTSEDKPTRAPTRRRGTRRASRRASQDATHGHADSA